MSRNLRTRQALFSLACAILGARPAMAADSYWDTNGTTAGAGGPSPAGTWGVNAFWTSNSNGTTATAAWSSSNLAVFSAGTDASDFYTVTVSGTQTTAGMRFEDGI